MGGFCSLTALLSAIDFTIVCYGFNTLYMLWQFVPCYYTCVVKRGLTNRFNIRYVKRERELDLVFMPCCLHDTFIKLDKYLGGLSFITLYTRFNFNCFTRSSIGNIFTSPNSFKPMCVLADAFITNRITLFWVHCRFIFVG